VNKPCGGGNNAKKIVNHWQIGGKNGQWLASLADFFGIISPCVEPVHRLVESGSCGLETIC